MHETLSALFLICFIVGAGLTVLSLLTGIGHLSLPGGHGLHVGHLGHVGHVGHLGHGGHLGHVGASGHALPSGQAASAGGGGQVGPLSQPEGPSPITFAALLAFIAWFGGGGYLLLLSPLALAAVLVLAALAGLAGASLIVLFMAKVLYPAQTSMDPEAYRLDGTIGRITATIHRDSSGEITYSKAGTRRAEAARSIDGQPIPRDEEVVILSYQRGVAYVQPLKQYLSTPAANLANELATLNESHALPTPQTLAQRPPTAEE